MNKKNYVLVFFKPDALERLLVSEILEIFLQNNFSIEQVEYTKVDRVRLLSHYEESIEKHGDSLEKKLIDFFEGRHILLTILSTENTSAIESARKLIGATDPSEAEVNTIRHLFGKDTMESAMSENRCLRNLLHCSDSLYSYNTELNLWFCREIAAKYIN